ncbi:hypothetical protein V6582_15110 [Agrobacterium vitis]|uniref:hypothetical protein n=1 Tax=Agrobacterium vitis TaxID=373 RepID=UPI0012E7D0E1|nr:hypothetical protein [Agrobacterium vitis]MVA27012.1 hypothetical protein [Agrobacterium vitis]
MSDQRIIAGTVKSTGEIISGDGFSVSRVSKGHYQVSFRPAFSKIGGASVTQIFPSDGNTKDNAVIISLDVNGIYVKTGDSGGDATDRNFTFVAVGNGSQTATV